MRRIERLINLIAALLETERPLTAEEIRKRVAGYGGESQEAFRRMFERDKADLRSLGIPLELKKLHPLDEVDGYVIPKEHYYLPDIDFEPDELAALHLAARSTVGSDAGAGVLKLAVDQPDVPGAALPVLWSTDLAAEQPILEALYSAALERNRVSFTYRQTTGETRSRAVDPYVLAHRRGHWYVVGRDVERDAVRTFRVSRIDRDVVVTGDGFEPPGELDTDEYLGGASWEIGAEPIRTVVRFNPTMRWWAQQNMSGSVRLPGPDGSVEVELDVANLDALAAWVIELGGEVTIVEPAAARDALLGHLEPFLGDPGDGRATVR